jgi:hypothetical protein
MAKSVIIKLTTAGTSVGPFNMLSDADSYVTPFETNVSRATLVTGYTSSLVPNAATIIRVLSSGSCTQSVDLTITSAPTTTTTTTTTSTTSTTTTAAPTTTTSTTTTTTTLPTFIASFSMVSAYDVCNVVCPNPARPVETFTITSGGSTLCTADELTSPLITNGTITGNFWISECDGQSRQFTVILESGNFVAVWAEETCSACPAATTTSTTTTTTTEAPTTSTTTTTTTAAPTTTTSTTTTTTTAQPSLYRYSAASSEDACASGLTMSNVVLTGGTFCDATAIQCDEFALEIAGISLYVRSGNNYRTATIDDPNTSGIATFTGACTSCTTTSTTTTTTTEAPATTTSTTTTTTTEAPATTTSTTTTTTTEAPTTFTINWTNNSVTTGTNNLKIYKNASIIVDQSGMGSNSFTVIASDVITYELTSTTPDFTNVEIIDSVHGTIANCGFNSSTVSNLSGVSYTGNATIDGVTTNYIDSCP